MRLGYVLAAAIAGILTAPAARSAPAPAQAEPVTRFRAVEGYTLQIKLKSDDNMQVDVGTDMQQMWFKEEFVARIDLTDRHLDNDYVEWLGEGLADQNLEETRKEVHFGGNFVQEAKATGRGRSKTKVKLYIDELKKTFSLWIDTEYIAATATGYRKDAPKPTEQLSYDTNLVTTGLRWMGEDYPLPSAGLALHVDTPYPKEQCGTYLQDWDWLQIHKEHAHLGRIQADLVPIGADEPDLLVEATGYHDWLPRGLETGGGPGASLPISARVVSRNGRPLEAQKIRLKLEKVTREPGVCINAPLSPPTNEPPDLSFEPGSGNVVITDAEHLVAENTNAPVYTAEVVVSSFDFGAYAVLEATAEVNGKPIVGHMVGEPPGSPITFPKCTGDSKVADAWRASMGIGAEADDSDAESDPGRQAIPGDGLTVYEEYRGVVAKIGHIRLDPKKKELMLEDRLEGTSVDAEAVRGTLLFQQATGIQIWWLGPAGHKDRQINFNHGSAVQRKCDQHAVVLKPAGLADLARPGEAARCVYTTNVPHPSPALVDRLVVFTDASGPQPAIDTRLQPVNIDIVSWAVAHELLHGVGVQHHGTGNRSGVVWTEQSSPWIVLEGGSPIDLSLESEPAGLAPYALAQLRQARLAGIFPTDPITVAVQGGEMSGDQHCLMRYAGAPAYEPAGGNPRARVFLLPGERDAAGTGLCTSGVGTGVNAHNRPNGLASRYGDSGTGGCAGQIHVSDVENAPAH